MRKKLTRAEKRQVIHNLYKKRNYDYLSKYVGQKSQSAISDWQDLQENLKTDLLKFVDEGVNYSEFIDLLFVQGFRPRESEIFTDLLEGYTLELEDLYPDGDEEPYGINTELQLSLETR